MRSLIFTNLPENTIYEISLQCNLRRDQIRIQKIPKKIESIPSFILLNILDHTDIEQVIWFDSIKTNLSHLEQLILKLQKSNIVLTESISKEISSHKNIDEKFYLKHGRFTDDCFGCKLNEVGLKFLNWWQTSFSQFAVNNLFDQNEGLLLNHVPVFFDGVSTISQLKTSKISFLTGFKYCLHDKLSDLNQKIDSIGPHWH